MKVNHATGRQAFDFKRVPVKYCYGILKTNKIFLWENTLFILIPGLPSRLLFLSLGSFLLWPWAWHSRNRKKILVVSPVPRRLRYVLMAARCHGRVPRALSPPVQTIIVLYIRVLPKNRSKFLYSLCRKRRGVVMKKWCAPMKLKSVQMEALSGKLGLSANSRPVHSLTLNLRATSRDWAPHLLQSYSFWLRGWYSLYQAPLLPQLPTLSKREEQPK